MTETSLDWTATLEQLEDDLRAYESLLDDPATPALAEWVAPDGLGPLPTALVPRPQAVLTKQQELRDRLATALSANTRQRGLAARITGATTSPSVPTYLDVTA